MLCVVGLNHYSIRRLTNGKYRIVFVGRKTNKREEVWNGMKTRRKSRK
jgi:hypothetical protein